MKLTPRMLPQSVWAILSAADECLSAAKAGRAIHNTSNNIPRTSRGRWLRLSKVGSIFIQYSPREVMSLRLLQSLLRLLLVRREHECRSRSLGLCREREIGECRLPALFSDLQPCNWPVPVRGRSG